MVRSLAGWGEDEAGPLLRHLFAMMNWPEFTVTHHWAAGDLLVWPNRRYAHRALPLTAGGERVLKRVFGRWA